MSPAEESGWRAVFRGTLAGTIRPGGRSSRRELINYVLCAVFFSLAVGLLLMIVLDYALFALFRDVVQLACFVPVPALAVRRLHDQDRSALFLWLAAPGTILWVLRKVLALSQPLAIRVAFDSWTWPIDAAAAFASLALIILLLLPGTAGPNRFGPDPRQQD